VREEEDIEFSSRDDFDLLIQLVNLVGATVVGPTKLRGARHGLARRTISTFDKTPSVKTTLPNRMLP
jgi:hypothetical protein